MRRLATCLVVAGCGRLSFDSLPVDDAAPDAEDELAITSREIEVRDFATTSSTFIDIPDATLIVPPSPGTRWLLLVSGYLTSTSLSFAGPEARYLVAGTERGIGGTESVDVAKPGPWQHFYVFDGATTSTPITFQLRDGALGEARISHLHAVVIPLPAAADPLYASQDAPFSVGMTEVEVASLSLPPATVGDYLVLMLVNASESPGLMDIDFGWFDPDGVAWDTSFKNPRGSRQSVLQLRHTTLSPPGELVRLRAVSGDMAEASYVRSLALRVGALPSYAEQTSSTYASTPSGPIEVSAIETQVAPAAKYLVFGSMRVDDICSAPVPTHGVHFYVDGVETYVGHQSGNCALEATYGFVDLVTVRPTRVSASISSDSGEIVEHRESTLFVMGVD